MGSLCVIPSSWNVLRSTFIMQNVGGRKGDFSKFCTNPLMEGVKYYLQGVWNYLRFECHCVGQGGEEQQSPGARPVPRGQPQHPQHLGHQDLHHGDHLLPQCPPEFVFYRRFPG